MIKIQEIQIIISKMAGLLRIGEKNYLANLFDGFNQEINHDPENVLMEILQTYDGMGSLNDVVLYGNGQPLIKENNEFDELRTKLYKLCRENQIKI